MSECLSMTELQQALSQDDHLQKLKLLQLQVGPRAKMKLVKN